MSARNRTYRPAAQTTAAARPSPDGGWRVVFPPAVGTHNPRSRETTRVAPFAHLHIGSFAHLHIGSFANSLKFSFSAKERDTETGLSYFGARYYSSDLSLWLSVDPMSGKYPHQSNYVYCSNNPIVLVDPNGKFDEESVALRYRQKAVRKYGEDRVSEVYNANTGNGSADYRFAIFGKGKTKYSRGVGTDRVIIKADKPDAIVTKGKDFRAYKRSQRGVTAEINITGGAQFGLDFEVKGRSIGYGVNVNSLDIVGVRLQEDGTIEGNMINEAYTNGQCGLKLGPITYEYQYETYFDQQIGSHHVSALCFELYNSIDSNNNTMSISGSVSFIVGIEFAIKKKRYYHGK